MSNSENTSNNMLLVSFDDFEIRKNVSIPVVADSGPCLHMVLSETRSPRPRSAIGGPPNRCSDCGESQERLRRRLCPQRAVLAEFLGSPRIAPGRGPALCGA